MEQVTLTIPPNLASAIINEGTTPLDRRLLELATIEAYRENLFTEWDVIDMLGFKDREELYKFFKLFDVRAEYLNLYEGNQTLDELLTQHNR